MAVTFDGDNLLIQLEPGVTSYDVQNDFYEPWKDYARASSANRRFPPAFRPIAGDAVTATSNYTGLFFLRNDNGWRFQLPDEDITVIATGLISLQDSTLPFFTPRAGRTGALIFLPPLSTLINADISNQVVEGVFTFQDVMKIIAATLGGKVSGVGTTTEIFRDLADSKNRVTTTLDGSGNRTSVTIDLTD